MFGDLRNEQTWADALRRERSGEASGYAAFLAEFAEVLRRLVRHRLSVYGLASQETEDVVQEVLMAVHSRRDQWDDSRPLLPWLGAISRYRIIDALRRRRTELRLRIDLSEREWLTLLQEESATLREDPDAIERAVSALPRIEQSAVRKVAMEGLSPREAAEATGLKEGTLRVAFHRGLARLLARARES